MLSFISVACSLLSSGGRRTSLCRAFRTPLAGHELGASHSFLPFSSSGFWSRPEFGGFTRRPWFTLLAVEVVVLFGDTTDCVSAFPTSSTRGHSQPVPANRWSTVHSDTHSASASQWRSGGVVVGGFFSWSFDLCPPVAAVCGDVSHLLAGLLSDWLGVRSSLPPCHFLLSWNSLELGSA